MCDNTTCPLKDFEERVKSFKPSITNYMLEDEVQLSAKISEDIIVSALRSMLAPIGPAAES